MAQYFISTKVDEALKLLASYSGRAQVIAGGTDLMLDLGKHRKQAEILVDITRIPNLDQIRIENGLVEIGAAVTFAAIKNCDYFKRHVHLLTEAASSVGAPSIQNAATWVGNLVQAMPAADGAIAALALEVEARVAEIDRADWRPVNTLFMGPGKSAIDSSKQMITHLRFKIPANPWGTAWERISRRSALTLPILNCAVKVELEKGRILRAAVALGPVASTPFKARETENFLADKPATQETFFEAGKIAQRESSPHSNVLRASGEYRSATIPALIHRALSTAVKRARGLRDEWVEDWNQQQ